MFTTPYNVIETDYVNYAIVYGCKQRKTGQCTANLWVLSRYQYVDAEFQQHISDKIKEQVPGIDRSTLAIQKQGGDCIYDVVSE